MGSMFMMRLKMALGVALVLAVVGGAFAPMEPARAAVAPGGPGCKTASRSPEAAEAGANACSAQVLGRAFESARAGTGAWRERRSALSQARGEPSRSRAGKASPADFVEIRRRARRFPEYLAGLGRSLQRQRWDYGSVFGGEIPWSEWSSWAVDQESGLMRPNFAWWASVVVFYENTSLDLSSGLVYHVQGAPPNARVYGPLLPPDGIRIRGDFTPEQLRELKGLMGSEPE